MLYDERRGGPIFASPSGECYCGVSRLKPSPGGRWLAEGQTDEGNGKTWDHLSRGPTKQSFLGTGRSDEGAPCRPAKRSFAGTNVVYPLTIPLIRPSVRTGAPSPRGRFFCGRARRPAPTDRARLGSRAPQTGHRPQPRRAEVVAPHAKGLRPQGSTHPKPTRSPQEKETRDHLSARRTTRRRWDRGSI